MSPRRTVPQKKQNELPRWVIPIGVGVVIVIFVILLNALQSPAAAVSTTPSLTGSSKTIGNPNSKIAFVVFADFQCPICRQFAVTSGQQIEDQYVKTNKISFTYKYYPVVDHGAIGESHWSAEAAECANQQGKFWEYHDKLIAVWVGENVGTFSKANLKQYAVQIGLDPAQFNPCIDNDQTYAVVQADETQAGTLGLPGTPSFLINGQYYNPQSLDFSEFSHTFDSLLK